MMTQLKTNVLARKWLTNEISSWANNSSGSKSQKQLENGQAKKSKVVSLADYEDGSESEHSLGVKLFIV